MICQSQLTLQKQTRAAWRRAADELLIDAIFGSTSRVIRDEDIRPERLRSNAGRDLPVAAVQTQAGQGLSAA